MIQFEIRTSAGNVDTVHHMTIVALSCFLICFILNDYDGRQLLVYMADDYKWLISGQKQFFWMPSQCVNI